jgi:hypothetical protein
MPDNILLLFNNPNILVKKRISRNKIYMQFVTSVALISFESPSGYGVLTASATQLAKIVVKIKYSKAL